MSGKHAHALFVAGGVAGMVMRIDAADFRAAAVDADLGPEHRALVECVARFREELESALRGDSVLRH